MPDLSESFAEIEGVTKRSKAGSPLRGRQRSSIPRKHRRLVFFVGERFDVQEGKYAVQSRQLQMARNERIHSRHLHRFEDRTDPNIYVLGSHVFSLYNLPSDEIH